MPSHYAVPLGSFQGGWGEVSNILTDRCAVQCITASFGWPIREPRKAPFTASFLAAKCAHHSIELAWRLKTNYINYLLMPT